MLHLRSTLIVLNLVCVFVFVVGDGSGPLVETKQGTLRGAVWETKKSRRFNAFIGIPYAKPPLGELRFQPPVPINPWKGIKDATKIHGVCPQRDVYRRASVIEGQEDCLYLNVYTPQLGNEAKSLLPVMVFFHGGGWLCGSGNSMWYSPKFLLDKDIVLVVMNYRLGALGFLSTGDKVSPGNNGLKDQNLALRWIQDNINTFGGDPKNVVLFGESAGGSSAHFHMLSKQSKGLLSAAISQSGTALSIWSVAPNDQGIKNSKKLAEVLNCPKDDSQKMVDCLRKIPAYKIVEQDVVFMEWDLDPMIPFKPVIEPDLPGAFLTKHPIEIIENGDYAKVPWIIGLNTEDGTLRAAGLYGNPHLLDEIKADFEKLIPISLTYKATADDADVDYITQKIKKFYFDNKNIDTSNSSRSNLVHLYTDAWFLSGADDAIRYHKKKDKSQPIYYYLFGHRGVASFSAIFGDPVYDYGVCHADDLLYLFPIGDGLFPEKTPTEKDKQVVDIMTTLWTNFAKYHDPSPELNDLITTKWEPVESDKMEYYYIDAAFLKMKRGLFRERAHFWRSLPIRGTSVVDPLYVMKDEL